MRMGLSAHADANLSNLILSTMLNEKRHKQNIGSRLGGHWSDDLGCRSLQGLERIGC